MSPTRWHQLKSLYDSAVDLSSGPLRRYLAAIPDRSIASRLGRLVKQDETNSYLEEPAWAVTDVEPLPPPRVLSPGDVLADRFEIGEFLGAGGMGEVHRAFDRDTRQWVALKTLRPETACQPLLVKRLRKEVHLARRVTHPNICRLYDVGRATREDGRELVFFTMELLEGRTLAEAVRERRFSPQEAQPIVSQLLAGLGAAHAAGIIHRDFKSGNILLVPEPGGATRAVITDFGLAREVESSVRESLSAFGSNAVVGTPAYMAPEQMEGQPVTAAADLYALGIVLFEMVTGRLPLEGSLAQVISQRLNKPAPDPRQHVPDLPSAWRATIVACLERNVAHRPRNADEVAMLLTGEVTLPRRVSRRQVVGGVVVAACAAGSGAFVFHRPEPSHAVHPEARRHYELGQVFAKRRTKEDLSNAVAEYEGAVRIQPDYATAWSGLADAYSAMANFNFIHPTQGLKKAREAALRAVELKPRSSRAQGAVGYVTSIDVHQWLRAEDYFVRAVSLDPNDAVVRYWYGGYLGKRGRFNEAIVQLTAGLALDPAYLPLQHQLAAEYFRSRQFAKFLVQALELARVQPYDAASHHALARAYEWHGQHEKALQYCERAEKFSDTPVSWCIRGCVEAARGKRDRALHMAERVHAHWRAQSFESLMLAALWYRLKKAEKSLTVLLAGYERGDSTIIGALTSPYLDDLRRDARFALLARRLNQPL